MFTQESEFLYQLDISINSTDHPNVIETNVGADGADPCHGDSGSPLMLKDLNQRWILVGTLIGGGYDCSKPFDRGDNTTDWNKVSIHVPWIQIIKMRLTGKI